MRSIGMRTQDDGRIPHARRWRRSLSTRATSARPFIAIQGNGRSSCRWRCCRPSVPPHKRLARRQLAQRLCIMPLSVATMNSWCASISPSAAFRMALVEPTASARATSRPGSRVHQHLGLRVLLDQSSSSSALNSSCTMHSPFQNSMSAPSAADVVARVAVRRPQDLLALVLQARTMSSAQLDVTIQSRAPSPPRWCCCVDHHRAVGVLVARR